VIEWTDRQTDRQTDGHVHEWIRHTDRYTKEWADKQMYDVRKNGQMDGQADE